MAAILPQYDSYQKRTRRDIPVVIVERLIRQHTTTPLAVGEIFSSVWDCKHLIENRLIDYIRATVLHAGGIPHMRQIASLADLHQFRTGCHGETELSPVTMAAALHLGLAIPNFGIQEYMRTTAATDPHTAET